VYGIELLDIDGDQDPDILMGGNLFAAKPEVGRYDAMHGLVLLNDGKGEFTSLSALQSGLKIEGEIRHIAILNDKKEQKSIAFIRNNDSIVFYKILK
jgi:hypothetical protein